MRFGIGGRKCRCVARDVEEVEARTMEYCAMHSRECQSWGGIGRGRAFEPKSLEFGPSGEDFQELSIADFAQGAIDNAKVVEGWTSQQRLNGVGCDGENGMYISSVWLEYAWAGHWRLWRVLAHGNGR